MENVTTNGASPLEEESEMAQKGDLHHCQERGPTLPSTKLPSERETRGCGYKFGPVETQSFFNFLTKISRMKKCLFHDETD